MVRQAAEAVRRSVAGVEEDAEKENAKGNRKDSKLLKQLKKGLKYLTSTLKQIEKMQKCLDVDDERRQLDALPPVEDEDRGPRPGGNTSVTH